MVDPKRAGTAAVGVLSGAMMLLLLWALVRGEPPMNWSAYVLVPILAIISLCALSGGRGQS